MASRVLPRLIRIPRTDGEAGDFIVLQVSSGGRRALDLNLIGTDGEEVYLVKVKHNTTSSLTSKNFSGTQAQFDETLSAVLLDGEETEFTRGVEAVAKVGQKTSIIITIQKSIEGIKQRLGTITLAFTVNEGISPFEWCGLAIQSREDSGKELSQLKEKLREKEEEIKKLNETLRELVDVKNAHEDDLLQKFSILLNEKKMKIRDQQRLLSAANVDPGRLEEVEQNRMPIRDSPPSPSRARKRKAATAAQDESDEDTDHGFEKMEVDAEAADAERNSADEDERRTEDEQSTADEDSEDEAPAVRLATRNTNNAKASGSGTTSEPVTETMLPPKRDLPFAKKAAPASKPAAPVEGSETESDDDEL